MISQRVKEISYAIREIAAVASEVAKSGKKIYHLNIGDPVIYDFKMPHYISQALSDASFNGKNYYVDSLGVPELREEIRKSLLQKYSIKISTEDILVTSGVTEAIFFLIATLIENGNEILIPGPSYPLYINYAKFFDGIPIEYELDESNDWEPNIDDLRKKITNKIFFVLVLLFAIFCISELITRTSESIELALIGGRIGYSISALAPCLAVHFSLVFPRAYTNYNVFFLRTKYLLTLLYICSIVVVFIFNSLISINDVRLSMWGYRVVLHDQGRSFHG